MVLAVDQWIYMHLSTCMLIYSFCVLASFTAEFVP